MKDSKDNSTHDKQEKKDVPFFAQVQNLPPVLYRRFLKQIFAAACIALLSIILMVYTKELEYCWGLLFALYFVYLALSLVWDYNEQKIVSKVMVCIKATRLSKERMLLILRDYDAPVMAENVTQSFYIPASKKDLNLISPNTIMKVYYDPRSPVELTGWEIVGIN